MGDLARLIGAVWKLTGGRPMRRIGYAFTDVVSGAAVYYWRDRLGRVWMAEGAFSMFRVPRHPAGAGSGGAGMKPDFRALYPDPLDAECCEGYYDGRRPDSPEPSNNRHPAYIHGFRCGRDDMLCSTGKQRFPSRTAKPSPRRVP